MMTAAATDLATIRSTLNAVNAAAAAHTTALLAAGADEVSAAIVALFSAHGQEYQALSAQAAAFQDEFVQVLTAGAASYRGAEAVNAAAPGNYSPGSSKGSPTHWSTSGCCRRRTSPRHTPRSTAWPP
jgi:hypothetical protein